MFLRVGVVPHGAKLGQDIVAQASLEYLEGVLLGQFVVVFEVGGAEIGREEIFDLESA